MTAPYVIPQRMNQYVRRLESEYRHTSFKRIGDVILNSQVRIEQETEYDWNSERQGHDVIFLIPESLMANIPLNEQESIESRLATDLNKACSSARDEYIANVRFDYLDEDGNAEPLTVIRSGAPHNYDRLWRPHTLRLFISHRDTAKAIVQELAQCLEANGVSSFVAHEAIEPNEDWQKEIRAALQSMDAMLVFITDDIFESIWVNQEIGYALARSVPIFSIKLGVQDPAGFIQNRQAIRGSSKDSAGNAIKVWTAMKKKLSDSSRYRDVVINQFMNAGSFSRAKATFEELRTLSDFTNDEISGLVEAYITNGQLYNCWHLSEKNRFPQFINVHSHNGYKGVRKEIETRQQSTRENIPF